MQPVLAWAEVISRVGGQLQVFFVVEEGGSHESSILPRGREEIVSMCVVGLVDPFSHF
jgi:hypothetical protein